MQNRLRKQPVPIHHVIRGNKMTYEIIPLHKNAKDILGQTFGRLTAIAPVGRSKGWNIQWLCICVCGTEKVAIVSALSSSSVASCGCLVVDANRKERHIHGRCGTTEYIAYRAMIKRCSDPTYKNYHRYGGRGIKILYTSFSDFFDDVGYRPDGKNSIDRINNDTHYERGNCRWATWAEQNTNTSRNRNITHNGKTMCLAEWAREFDIPYGTLQGRLNRGWSINRALTAS